MDELIVLAVIALFLLPLVMLVLLFKLLSRQTSYQQEITVALRALIQAVGENAALLRKLDTVEPAAQVNDRQAADLASNQQASEEEPEPLISFASENVESLDDGEFAEQSGDISAAGEEIIPDTSGRGPADAWAQTLPELAPSRFELAAKHILKQIWNWITVGEGHRPEGVTIEYAVASNWLLRIGVLILVTGIGFFLKYSIDNQLLGEQARVALSVLAGVAMIVGGVRLVGGTYHLFSQGLLGGGIAVLYFSVFAAHSFYHLLAMYPTFALMVVVTACAAALAITLDSMLVAIFAIIGGYCTPILLSTGQVNFIGLFSYMLLLGGGMLAINWFKQWHLLNFLSFFFTYLLFFGAMQKYQISYFWQVFPFLCSFFVLYSTSVTLYCLVNKIKSNLLDLLALIINAGIFFSVSYTLIQSAYGQIWVALLSVLLAAFYVGHVYFCLAKRVSDSELLLSFIGMAAFFVTIALPLILSKQWITVSWSLQAVLMLWLAGKLRSAFLQRTAYLLYVIVLFRFCLLDLPDQYGRFVEMDQSFLMFLLGMLERVVSFGIPIASLALAYRLIEKPAPASPLAGEQANDAVSRGDDNLLMIVIALGGVMLFVVLQLELNRSFSYLYPPLRLPVLSLVWLAACWLILLRYLTVPQTWLLQTLQLLLLAVILKLLFFDLPSWHLGLGHISAGDSVWTLRYRSDYSFELALMRLLDFAAIIGFCLFAFRRLPADPDNGKLRQYFAGTALVLLFMFLSLEVNSMLYRFVPGLRSGGVSILWSVIGLSLVFSGIKYRISKLRLTGLALFAVVAWKVFFIDLARLEQIYRIVAFILLGMLALGGAFFYMRSQQNFVGTKGDEASQ